MRKIILATSIIALSVNIAFAAGEVILNDENKAKIEEMLIAQGYEVRKIKIEDGMYEAYAKSEGGRFEIYLDGDFTIVKIEED